MCGRIREICILVLVFIYFITTNSLEPSCNSSESCVNYHLNHNKFAEFLRWRCKMENESRFRTSQLPFVTVTHLPKTGGSSITKILHNVAKTRSKVAHQHYIISSTQLPQSLFVTIFREPTSRAVSFYCYVNDRKRAHQDTWDNKLWINTIRKDPVKWSENPFIQRTLALDPLPYFLRHVVNVSDTNAKFDFRSIQQMKDAPLKYKVPYTQKQYLQYLSDIPGKYQCKSHIEVAYILLSQYEVVGILENREDFIRVLFHRASLPQVDLEGALADRSNPCSYKMTEDQREAMRANLYEPFYCSGLLWKIAGAIGTNDRNCIVFS